MALSVTNITNAIYGLFSKADATDETLIRNTITRRTVEARLFDAATAGTAMTETCFFKNLTGASIRITAAWVVAPVAVAADNTDYVTFTVAQRTSAGASSATVASADSRAASLNALVAFAPEALTLTAANIIVADGAVLTVAVAKAGSGKAITAATSDAYLIVQYEPAN